MTTWNQRLAEVCRAKRVTKTELAQLGGVSVPTASDWVKGEIKAIEGPRLLKICDGLGVDPWWLMFGTPKGDSPITEGKTPLSNEAKKLILWVERVDSLGDPALKILSHVSAAISVAESIRQVQHSDVVSQLEEHERLVASHAETKGAEKHASRTRKQ